jgi:hypothetical protein
MTEDPRVLFPSRPREVTWRFEYPPRRAGCLWAIRPIFGGAGTYFGRPLATADDQVHPGVARPYRATPWGLSDDPSDAPRGAPAYRADSAVSRPDPRSSLT